MVELIELKKKKLQEMDFSNIKKYTFKPYYFFYRKENANNINYLA